MVSQLFTSFNGMRNFQEPWWVVGFFKHSHFLCHVHMKYMHGFPNVSLNTRMVRVESLFCQNPLDFCSMGDHKNS